MIIYTCDNKPIPANIQPNISFMGGTIQEVSWDYHLGHPIGRISQDDIIKKSIYEFQSRVNMVKTHFKQIPAHVMYHLFKTYCMPMYGSQLWDYSNDAVNAYFISWRKAIRYVLNLPIRTHCKLLHHICEDLPIHEQMYSRFIKFYRSVLNSPNQLTCFCAKLAQQGSNSSVGNSTTMISKYLNISRYTLHSTKLNRNIINNEELNRTTASVIKDTLNALYIKNLHPFECQLSVEELKYIIVELCIN